MALYWMSFPLLLRQPPSHPHTHMNCKTLYNAGVQGCTPHVMRQFLLVHTKEHQKNQTCKLSLGTPLKKHETVEMTLTSTEMINIATQGVGLTEYKGISDSFSCSKMKSVAFRVFQEPKLFEQTIQSTMDGIPTKHGGLIFQGYQSFGLQSFSKADLS